MAYVRVDFYRVWGPGSANLAQESAIFPPQGPHKSDCHSREEPPSADDGRRVDGVSGKRNQGRKRTRRLHMPCGVREDSTL